MTYSSLYDRQPAITPTKHWGRGWYEPQSGVFIGEGPDRSFVFCLKCHQFIIKPIGKRLWPETIKCGHCGEVVATRRLGKGETL